MHICHGTYILYSSLITVGSHPSKHIKADHSQGGTLILSLYTGLVHFWGVQLLNFNIMMCFFCPRRLLSSNQRVQSLIKCNKAS